MLSSHEPTHISNTRCVLCRQPARSGSHILDPDGIQYVANVCKSCVLCSIPAPHMWFHRSCYDILMESYPLDQRPTLLELEDFGDATKEISKPLINYTFSPASIHEGLLSTPVQATLDSCFRQELISQLPIEVLRIIIDFIGPCSYLIVLGETRRLLGNLRKRNHQDEYSVLSLSQDLYITRLDYRGMSYISSISNTPTQSADEECIGSPGDVQQLWLLATHVGIHRIHFGALNSELSEKVFSTGDGIWYEHIEAREPCDTLGVVHHALFLRSCQLRSKTSGTFELNRTQKWDLPRVPNIHPRNAFQMRKDRLFSYMPLDYSRLIGLVCCVGYYNMGLFPLPDSTDGYSRVLSRFKGFRKFPGYWMFFPISHGEYIVRVWARRHDRSPMPDLALQTSRNRWALFGAYPRSTENRDLYKMVSLTSANDGPVSGFCHDGLDPDHTGISGYGVTCNPDLSIKESSYTEPLREPIWYPYTPPIIPGRPYFASWYMTRALLSGLVQVQVCRSVEKSFQRCLGLLLHYENGSFESLGQVRWDQIISDPIPTPIRVQLGRLGPWKEGCRYILDVRSVSDMENAARWGAWTDIPDEGYLVWWFGRYGDRIMIHRR